MKPLRALYPSSPLATTGPPLPSAGLGAALADFLASLFHILPLSIFVFIMCVPTDALAYAQVLEISQQPLIFIRDPGLAEQAIMGIDAFPNARTAGQLLSSRASTIRSVNQAEVREGAAVRVLAFAYSSASNQTDADPLTTASGHRVKKGTMAANWLPFGARVRIGNQVYTISDRMNERYDNKYIVDIWQPSHAEAIQWGARVIEMEIVSLPDVPK